MIYCPGNIIQLLEALVIVVEEISAIKGKKQILLQGNMGKCVHFPK
jgi:hypothetical protein